MAERTPTPPPDFKGAPEDYKPPRGYSWEPFKPGNLAAVKHGVYSDRTIQPLAERIAEAIVEEAPELGAPRFRFALSAWAHAEARAALLRFLLGGVIDADKPPEKWLKELRAEERRAAEERRELGLSPSSYAKLQREMADAAKGRYDLEKLTEEGREIRLRAAERLGIDLGPAEEEPDAS